MRGIFSVGQINNKLVDSLIESRFIKTHNIERVFRSVDRAHYILAAGQAYANENRPWKHGNLHLSAPCIYAAAMELLDLKPGQSFLNIGSGTGYLNTMAGLLIGPRGTNHGIELYEDCVEYAYDRLEEFKHNSPALKEFEFCEPTFILGNCFNLTPDRQYDRVYCGAAVPDNHAAFFKQFVRVGGLLVMPYIGRLVCSARDDERTWNDRIGFRVSFAMLVIPEIYEPNSITVPDFEPTSFHDLSRGEVRQNICTDDPELESENYVLANQRHFDREASDLSRVSVPPIFDDADVASSISDDEYPEDRAPNKADFIRGVRLLLKMHADTEETL